MRGEKKGNNFSRQKRNLLAIPTIQANGSKRKKKQGKRGIYRILEKKRHGEKKLNRKSGWPCFLRLYAPLPYYPNEKSTSK